MDLSFKICSLAFLTINKLSILIFFYVSFYLKLDQYIQNLIIIIHFEISRNQSFCILLSTTTELKLQSIKLILLSFLDFAFIKIQQCSYQFLRLFIIRNLHIQTFY